MTEMKALSRILIFFVVARSIHSQWRTYKQFSYEFNGDHCELEHVTSASDLTGLLEGISQSFYDDSYGHKYLSDFKIFLWLHLTIEKVPPLFFQKFGSLDSFTAAGVQLQEISRDDFKYACNLKILDLAYNNLTRLESKLFSNMQALEHIDCSNNQIAWIHDNVFEGISKKLTRIDLSFNKLVTLKEESFMLFDSINLLEINLKHNAIREFTTSTQKNEMKKPWINLSLSNNSLNSIEISSINLRKIDLANNAVYEFQAKNNKLEEIHIGSKTKLVSAENNEITMVELENSSNLETLRLSGNKVGNEILQELKKARSLVTLYLSDTSLASLSVDSFSEFENLTVLNLDMNSISSIDYGVFSHQKNLKQLNISHNNLLAIDFHVLASLSSLQTLDISGNKISQINDHALLNIILPKLSNLGIEGNSWSCEYLSKLRINLQSQNISILKAIRPIKESSSIAGIVGCVTNSSESVSLINNGVNNEVVGKVNQLAEKFNLTSTTIDNNKTDMKSLIFGLQKGILSMKSDISSIYLSTTNASNINEVRLLIEQMSNNTLERQKLAIDQLTNKINEWNEETLKLKSQSQQFKNEKVSGFSSTEICVAIVLTVLVTLAVIFGIHKVRKYFILRNNRPRHRPSRHSSIAIIDNSSVQTLL